MVLQAINKILFKTVVFFAGTAAMKDKTFWSLPLLLISSSKTLWRSIEMMTRKVFIPLAALRQGRGWIREEDGTVRNGGIFVRQNYKPDEDMRKYCRNLSAMFVWRMFYVSNDTFDEQPKKLIEYQNNWFVKHIIWWKMTIYWLMVGFC